MKDLLESLNESYLSLLQVDIARQLPGNLISQRPSISREEKLYLLTSASVLALSDLPEERSLAYEIAARIIETSVEDPSLISASIFIMSRLGNFPGRELAIKRFFHDSTSIADHPLLAIESIAREVGNTVQVAGQSCTLTDFQIDFFSILEKSDSASISAPTSAGKSFVLSLGILKRISVDNKLNIAYIVPTRALLGQVTRNFLSVLKKVNLDLPVRCVPIPLDAKAKTGCIYVLTQERLISLLQAFGPSQRIDVLIVDEAQSVGDGARGVLLQTAIERVKILNPCVRVFFASPLTKNPNILLDYFGTGDQRSILREKHSPVLQNIILVKEVNRRVKEADFFVLNVIGENYIGRTELNFKFRDGLVKQKAFFAKSITRDEESTIIYCNDPWETEYTASELSAFLEETADQDVYDFSVFLKEHIHEQYSLAEVLLKGVAYHYGSMPNIVRSRIEQLAKNGKLKYICCTSTLLQGVNLPARNIIIERPRKGKSNPMGRADFLNLAGRAGRLLHEFQGNVWCLRPDLWDKPQGDAKPCYDGADTQKIRISFVEALNDGGKLLQEVLEDNYIGDRQSFDLGVAALGKIFGDFILAGVDLPSSYLSTSETVSQLSKLQDICKNIKLTIPIDIVKLNPSVHPKRLQKLYDFMSSKDLRVLFPVHPQRRGSNKRLQEIFRIVSDILEHDSTNAYKFDAWLANEWMHDMPLKSIIEGRLKHKFKLYSKELEEKSKIGRELEIRPPEPKKVIYEILEALQQRIRFRYVKNLRVYKQILGILLVEAGRSEEVDEILPIDLFLECGSANTLPLSLMGIGLTRTTALMLKGKLKFPEEPTPEACLAILAATDLNRLDIPVICRKEVQELVGYGS